VDLVGPLGSLFSPWVRGWSLGPIMAAVGAYQVTWAHRGRRGGAACPLGPRGRRGGVTGPFGLLSRRKGVAGPLGPVRPPWERIRSPGSHLAAVMAWPVPWASSGCHGGVAGAPVPVRLMWGQGRSPGPHETAVGAWPIPWAP